MLELQGILRVGHLAFMYSFPIVGTPECWKPRLNTYRTNEAGVMPGMPQGFDKLVTSFHREITAMTLGAEQVDIV